MAGGVQRGTLRPPHRGDRMEQRAPQFDILVLNQISANGLKRLRPIATRPQGQRPPRRRAVRSADMHTLDPGQREGIARAGARAPTTSPSSP